MGATTPEALTQPQTTSDKEREIRNTARELLALCDGDFKAALRHLEISYEDNWE